MKARTILLGLALSGLFISCNEYYDDLEGLGKRVVKLEESTLQIDNSLKNLELLTQAASRHGYITKVDNNADGSCTIHLRGPFGAGGELTDSVVTFTSGEIGRSGRDGQAAVALLDVTEGADGLYYWTFNGTFLLDADGNPIPVRGADGKDGKDGKDGEDGDDGADGLDASPLSGDVVLPMVRISDDDRTWEISLDGGLTWQDTNVKADGENGKDGKDGKDGVDGKDGENGKNGENGKSGQSDSVIIDIIETPTEVIFVVHVSPSGAIQSLVVPKG